MLKRLALTVSFVLTLSTTVLAQKPNPSPSPQRPRTTNTNTATPTPSPAARQTPVKPPAPAASDAVLAAFEKLMDGIRHANVDEVTAPYWNSPRLILFNNNGTVTKGWEQMRKNRESSYPELKDVKLEIRDRHIEMLGRDGAVVTCLWTQSQTYKGTPDSATGRMTLVFRRIGTEWKAVHLHTSTDRPDPARVPSAERTPAATPTPTPAPRP